nr:hypothetical protein [Tanacetum cinerariifolium]
MNYLEEQMDGEAMINSIKNGDVNDDMGSKKKSVMVTSDPLALIAEKMKVSKSKEKVVVSSDSEGSDADDFSELKTITALLSANKKQEFVKNDNKTVEKKDDEKKRDMSRVKCYNCKKEGHFTKDCKKVKVKDYEYYMIKMLLAKKDKDKQGLFVNNDDDQEIFHDAIESASENFIENHIDSQKDYDKSNNCVEKANRQSKDFENQNKDLQDKYDVLKNQTTIFEMNNKELNEQLKELIEKNNDFLAQTKVLKDQLQVKHVMIDTHVDCQEKYAKLKDERYNPRYFKKAKDLRPTLYDEKVIGLGYTPMFLTHFDEALEIKKFKRSKENKIEFAYDYKNLNASYVNEKIKFEDDYFQEIINPDFEKIDSPFQQTSLLKPYVPNVILEKIIIDLEDEVINLLKKEKVNLKTTESLKSKGFETSETVCSESENQSENVRLVVEKECDKEENPKVIAPGMFKLNVS